MATTPNTSHLLLIARVIPSPEGYVWVRHTVATGTDPAALESAARALLAGSTHLLVPVLIQLVPTGGTRAALRQARRKIEALVTRLNATDYHIA